MHKEKHLFYAETLLYHRSSKQQGIPGGWQTRHYCWGTVLIWFDCGAAMLVLQSTNPGCWVSYYAEWRDVEGRAVQRVWMPRRRGGLLSALLSALPTGQHGCEGEGWLLSTLPARYGPSVCCCALSLVLLLYPFCHSFWVGAHASCTHLTHILGSRLSLVSLVLVWHTQWILTCLQSATGFCNSVYWRGMGLHPKNGSESYWLFLL